MSGDTYPNANILMPNVENGTIVNGYFTKDQKACLYKVNIG